MTRPLTGSLQFTGINMDQVPGDVPADWWSGGRNVMFRAGKTVRVPGEGRFAETGRMNAADQIHYFDAGVQQWWIYASARSGVGIGVAVTDGTNHYNITPFTPGPWAPIATKNSILTIGDLNGLPFVNHPEIGPFWWDGDPSHRMALLPGWTSGDTCRVMRAHKNFLMAICMDFAVAGLQEGVCRWSTSADPGQVPQEWTPTPTNDAGEFTFGQPGGPLLDGLSVRDQFFLAKANAMYAGQYVGGQFVFDSRDLFPSIGLYAANCWVEFGNVIYFLSGQLELLRTDGSSAPQNLLYGILQEYMRNQVNAQYPSSAFLTRDDPHGQVMVCYPVGDATACEEAITYEATSDRPGIRDLAAGVWSASTGLTTVQVQSWDSDPQQWNLDSSTWNETASGYLPAHLVFGGGSAGLIEMGGGTGVQFVFPDGSLQDYVSYAERSGIDFDDMEYRKAVSSLTPRITGVDGVTVQFVWSVQDFDEGAVEETLPQPFTVGTTKRLDFVLDGVLHGVRATSQVGAQWALSKLHAAVKRTGRSQ